MKNSIIILKNYDHGLNEIDLLINVGKITYKDFLLQKGQYKYTSKEINNKHNFNKK